jgi:hypothetical protein
MALAMQQTVFSERREVTGWVTSLLFSFKRTIEIFWEKGYVKLSKRY